MRLFTAVLLNEDIKDSLYITAQRIKQSGVKCRITAKDNLHLTLIFLGEHDIKGLTAIKSAMDSVKAESFTLSVGGLGSFKQGRGSIIWAGADGAEVLLSLRVSLKHALEEKGLSVEDKFTPHITLCREAQGLPSSLEVYKERDAAPMTVGHISLMKSERINGVLTYTEIYSVPLD